MYTGVVASVIDLVKNMLTECIWGWPNSTFLDGKNNSAYLKF